MNWKELFKSIGILLAVFGGILLAAFILFGVPILAAEIHRYLAVFSVWFIWSIFGSFLWPFKKTYLSPKEYLLRFIYALLIGVVVMGIFIGGIETMMIWPITSQYVMIGSAMIGILIAMISLVISIYNHRTK